MCVNPTIMGTKHTFMSRQRWQYPKSLWGHFDEENSLLIILSDAFKKNAEGFSDG